MTRDVAKVFMSGRSQAVRIPMEFSFSTPEVLVMRKGDSLVLSPHRPMTWSRFFAEIRSAPDRSGKTIGVMDALIAANAIAEGCVLVTNNTAHFSRIKGLRIENWMADAR